MYALQTLRGHEHVVEAVSMGQLHFSALVELAGGVANHATGDKASAQPIEKVDNPFSTGRFCNASLCSFFPVERHPLSSQRFTRQNCEALGSLEGMSKH